MFSSFQLHICIKAHSVEDCLWNELIVMVMHGNAPVAKVPVRWHWNIVLETDSSPFHVYSKEILPLHLLCAHNFLRVFLYFPSSLLIFFLSLNKCLLFPSLFIAPSLGWPIHDSKYQSRDSLLPLLLAKYLSECHVLKSYTTCPDYLENHLNQDRNTQWVELSCLVYNSILDWLR